VTGGIAFAVEPPVPLRECDVGEANQLWHMGEPCGCLLMCISGRVFEAGWKFGPGVEPGMNYTPFSTQKIIDFECENGGLAVGSSANASASMWISSQIA
jgi:hypothetical protein